jgi:hypothetical protein
MDHATKRLVNPADGETVDIDVELVGIIAAAWRLGVRTVQCCQHEEESDSAWIQFLALADASRFLAAIFGSNPDEGDDLLDRQRDWEIASPEPSRARLGWRWKVAPVVDHHGAWDFDAMVEFPSTDIHEVERRMLAATVRQ